MDRLDYPIALLRNSFAVGVNNRWLFVLMSTMMFVQNSMFFILWIVFFHSVRDVRGWMLQDVCLFWGISCLGIGLAFFLGDGSRQLGGRIVSGELDEYLVRPRHPLPPLISLSSNSSSLGDIVFGLVLLIFFAHVGVGGLCLCLVAAIMVCVLFTALSVSFQSLAFFFRGGDELADELLMAMICLSSVPQHAAGMILKLVLFTVLPAGFITIVPVEAVRGHHIWLLALMAVAVAVHCLVALTIFRAGLRRYTSATGWTV